MTRLRGALAVLLLALASPASASAHAYLVRSTPAAGAAVASAPARVLLVFDEPVSPAHVDVTSAGGASVAAGKAATPKGHPKEIVVPLRPGLPHGGYVVHWSEVDEDDGHLVSGAFGFAIGAGSVAPTVPAGGGDSFRGGDAAARWLLLAGLLAAGGLVGFRRLAWRRRERAAAFAAAAGVALAVAAVGAAVLLALQPQLVATRFDRITLAGAGGAALAALLQLASLRLATLRLIADAAAVALLALPTIDGHALAQGPSHLLSVPADLVHVAAAALWTGGVLALVAIVPPDDRRAAVRRFAPFAAGAVAALAVTGVLRAVGELRSVSQLWSTPYGNAILAKTVLFAAVVAVAAASHGRPGRRALLTEGTILLGLVAGVAVLTGLRPGRDVLRVLAAPARPPAFVTAGEAGDYAVGVALTAEASSVRARATVLGQQGPAGGLTVTIASSGHVVRADACGTGCYEASLPVRRPDTLVVSVERKGTARLRVPKRWPPPRATTIVTRATRTFRQLRSLEIVSHLASSATIATTTLWKLEAPNSLFGLERETGAGEVIIGNRRWDRDSRDARWVASPQTPLRQPTPPWPPLFRNAHVLRAGTVRGRAAWIVTFYDPRTPAWFTAAVDRKTYRTYWMDMIATAHFMHEDYRSFDRPLRIAPPK